MAPLSNTNPINRTRPIFLLPGNTIRGDMTPDEPLIDDVPDSKTNVKVRVHYRFSKTPIY